jgi:hypothetical protein
MELGRRNWYGYYRKNGLENLPWFLHPAGEELKQDARIQ